MLPKKLKDAKLEDIQAVLPDVFEAIFALGKKTVDETLAAENAALKAEIAEAKADAEAEAAEQQRKTEILSIGTKLNVSQEAETCIAEGKSVEESMRVLIDAAAQQKNSALEGFEQTAAPAAGDASADAGEVEITDFSTAVEFIRKRDNCSKADATKKAVSEFSKLHENLRKGGTNVQG